MGLTHFKLLFRRFSPLEERLLAAVRTVVPLAARSTYDAQVLAITRVQRHPRWTEIIFYRIRKGKVDWSDVPSFPCPHLADVRFLVCGKSHKATLACFKGHIGIFAVTPSPKQVAFEAWDGVPAVRLLDNPMRAPTGKAPVESIALKWREFLLEHSEKTMADWVLYDDGTAYRVPSSDGEYIVLAERDGNEFILQNVKVEGDSQEQLFYLSSHDGTPELIRGALENFIKPSRTD